jgi:hypothetical protein
MFEEAGLRVRKRSCYEDDASLVIQIVAMGAKANHEHVRVRLAGSQEYTLRR